MATYFLTVEDMIEHIRGALERWRGCHDDPETWADEWVCGEPMYYYRELDGHIGNGYFEFDWKGAAIRRMAMNSLTEYCRCPKCSWLVSDYDQLCGCDDEDEPWDNWERLHEDDVGDLAMYLEDVMVEPSEAEIMDALVLDGFPIYREALAPYIDGILDEIQEALDKIDYASDPGDRLAAAIAAAHISHVHGNILDDYGTGDVDFATVADIAENGLSDYFTSDEVKGFLLS